MNAESNIIPFPSARTTTASRAREIVERVRSQHRYPVGSILVSRNNGNKLTVLALYRDGDLDPWYMLQRPDGARTLLPESMLQPLIVPMMPDGAA